MHHDVKENRMIALEDVSFAYAGQCVIDHITLTVKAGQRVGIIGESGCGKSTLLKLMAGLYTPTGGAIRVAGEKESEKMQRVVSMVMQTPMLFPMTIYENITLGHAYAPKWVAQVCEAAGLGKWIASLPEGMDTYLGDSANELSGGQAQRIAIARALCKDADILLLDEPISALDQETGLTVLAALKEFTIGKTVIHVTHQPTHLGSYDSIYQMRDGSLLPVVDSPDIGNSCGKSPDSQA